MARKSRSNTRPAGARAAAPARTPEVILDFVFEDGLLFISLENIGDGPAHDVRVRFAQDIHGVRGTRRINALQLFSNTEFLAPRKSIRTFLDTSAQYFARKEPTRITAHLSYLDSARRPYRNTIHHDLGIYQDIGYIRRETSGR